MYHIDTKTLALLYLPLKEVSKSKNLQLTYVNKLRICILQDFWIIRNFTIHIPIEKKNSYPFREFNDNGFYKKTAFYTMEKRAEEKAFQSFSVEKEASYRMGNATDSHLSNGNHEDRGTDRHEAKKILLYKKKKSIPVDIVNQQDPWP